MTDLEIECACLNIQETLRYVAGLERTQSMTGREALEWVADLFVKALDKERDNGFIRE